MANMLIRTRQTKCSVRLAVLIRVILFFGIPTIYFTYSSLLQEDHQQPAKVPSKIISDFRGFSSRNLLSVPERNCTPAAILEFPPDGFNSQQRKNGFIAVHCVLAIYCFLLLGTVCEQYFVPAIQIICERLEMPEDIAGATFMAAASSSPELFINCVGTFVTEGDLGVGAIVGSAVFNVLAVPACCGLIAGKVTDLDWWSVSRDCLMYAVSVVTLILTMLDNKIYWHEALLLVLMYAIYILTMVFNGQLGRFVKSGCCGYNKSKMYTEVTPLLSKDKKSSPVNGSQITKYSQLPTDNEFKIEINKKQNTVTPESSPSVLSWPGEEASKTRKFLWVLTWPLSLVLWATIPDCRRYPKLCPLTFFMCISWIGGISYLVAWIITILGDTLNVPDSITGLTILAAGTSLPEAVSSVLVTNQGHGTMGISNSIGSNTFDILLCLGLPWLVKSFFFPSVPGNHWVAINSNGLSYSAISLLSTLLALYVSLALNKFQLDWKIGVTCTFVYIGFLTMSTLIELNVFFMVNIPVCPH